MTEKIQPRIFVAEDSSLWKEIISKEIEKVGAILAFPIVDNISIAMTAIETLAELEIDIAIIDGNLDENDGSGKDGVKMIEEIRKQASDVKIIGFSANTYPLELAKADIVIKKTNSEFLGTAILQLYIEKTLEKIKEEVAETGKVPPHIQQLIDLLEKSEE